MKFFTAMICLVIALTGCVTQKGSATEGSVAEERLALREAIENQEYYIAVHQMSPTIGNPSTFVTNFSVSIKGDDIHSYLPFFGRVYTSTYGGDNPLNFESKIEDYQLSFDRKGKATVKLATTTKDDTFYFRIEIFPDGTTAIHIRSNHRDSMSYRGTATKNRR